GSRGRERADVHHQYGDVGVCRRAEDVHVVHVAATVRLTPGRANTGGPADGAVAVVRVGRDVDAAEEAGVGGQEVVQKGAVRDLAGEMEMAQFCVVNDPNV